MTEIVIIDEHDYEILTDPFTGKEEKIDVKMVPVIEALWHEYGIRTQFCCQGDDEPRPYRGSVVLVRGEDGTLETVSVDGTEGYTTHNEGYLCAYGREANAHEYGLEALAKYYPGLYDITDIRTVEDYETKMWFKGTWRIGFQPKPVGSDG